jgi:4-amino-4-deoxy-L-arabinose transferase-like glycosyltransferase
MARSGRLITHGLFHPQLHRAAWCAVLALTLVAFALRAPGLDAQSLWRDEVDVMRLADQPLPQLARSLVQAGHNGPFYYLLMQSWLRLAGESEFGLRYLALCFGVLTVPLAYWVGRRLMDWRAAALTASLVAVSPYLVWYSQDAKMYALLTALTLLAAGCQLEALATGRLRWWAGFVVAASLSLYVHILAALMIPVYAAAWLLARPARRRAWWAGAVALGLLTLPYLPLALWQWPLVLNTYETGHPFYPLTQMLSLLFNLQARGMAMVGGWAVLAAFVFAMLGGLFSPLAGGPLGRSASRQRSMPRRVRPRVFLLLWLFLPVVLVYLVSLRAAIFEPRYLIFVAPAFYLLTGLGLMALARLSQTAAGLALAVALAFSLLGVWTQATTPIKSDFRAAADYVKAHRQGEAPLMFHMPYVRYTFDYYFKGKYVALEGPWTNDGRSEAQVEAAMANLLQGYSDVWLVASESWLWDTRGLARAWLDRHARLVESASFTLVDVYHYEMSDLNSTN